MNDNIYPNQIKFEMKCNRKELMFLDTKETVGPGKGNNDKNKVYIIPTMWSKPMYTHQYLKQSSCHSPHITKKLPSSVISRIPRNCSDNVENNQIFKDTFIEYKAYLMKSG